MRPDWRRLARFTAPLLIAAGVVVLLSACTGETLPLASALPSASSPTAEVAPARTTAAPDATALLGHEVAGLSLAAGTEDEADPTVPSPSPTTVTKPLVTAGHAATATPEAETRPTLAPSLTVASTATRTRSTLPAQATPTPTAPPLSPLRTETPVADVGLDPGHHRLDVGASGGGLREYEVTLDIALRAKRRLEAAGLRVALSRADHAPVAASTSQDATERIRLEQEARIKAVGNARVYVSIHLNAFDDPRLGGTETYFNPDAGNGEGRRLATALQSGVVRRLADAGYVSPNRGAKSDLSAGKPYGHFFSLRGPMPSALVEALFLSHPAEAALLGRDSVRDAISNGIADGVLVYLGR